MDHFSIMYDARINIIFAYFLKILAVLIFFSSKNVQWARPVPSHNLRDNSMIVLFQGVSKIKNVLGPLLNNVTCPNQQIICVFFENFSCIFFSSKYAVRPQSARRATPRRKVFMCFFSNIRGILNNIICFIIVEGVIFDYTFA